MVFNGPQKIRPTVEDLLRALAYFGVLVWTVVFLIFPPSAYISTVDTVTRYVWVGTCALGAFAAMAGALLRIDLKLELPGIGFMGVGPVFYMAAQIWLVAFPPATATDPNSRTALIVYAILPLLFTLPRAYSLYSESQRSSSIRKEMKRSYNQSTKEG